MKPISDSVVCVVDRGLFPHIAQCLADKCKHVYYTGPSERVMRKLADSVVGDGFQNISREPDLWRVKAQCDFFVFPDTGFAGEQAELLDQGFPVWGHHGADELETDKGLFLKVLGEVGLAVPPHEVVQGVTALRDHVRDREDLYIKVSRFRGDWETFHWRDWTMDEVALDAAAYRFGPLKELVRFYVFEAVGGKIEDGLDTWCIEGQWPKTVLHGMERKDKSLIGSLQPMAEVPDEIRSVNELFGPVLARYGMRGAFSTEIRPPYFIDPTIRFGSPPSQLQTALIRNLPEVIQAGAQGECLEPESEHSVGAQVLITTDREKDEWASFPMPAALRPWVKTAFSCEVGGVVRVAPNPLENWAGWLVATGDTVEEVIETLKERKKLLPDGFDCDLTSLGDLLIEDEAAKAEGIDILPEPVPEPAAVLDS